VPGAAAMSSRGLFCGRWTGLSKRSPRCGGDCSGLRVRPVDDPVESRSNPVSPTTRTGFSVWPTGRCMVEATTSKTGACVYCGRRLVRIHSVEGSGVWRPPTPPRPIHRRHARLGTVAGPPFPAVRRVHIDLVRPIPSRTSRRRHPVAWPDRQFYPVILDGPCRAQWNRPLLTVDAFETQWRS